MRKCEALRAGPRPRLPGKPTRTWSFIKTLRNAVIRKEVIRKGTLVAGDHQVPSVRITELQLQHDHLSRETWAGNKTSLDSFNIP